MSGTQEKRDRDGCPPLLQPEPPDLGYSCQWVTCFWDKAAMDPLTPSPSYPLLPCPLSFSPWPVLMWAPESISTDPLPFLLLLPAPSLLLSSSSFHRWSIPLILAPSCNPPHPTSGRLQLL